MYENESERNFIHYKFDVKAAIFVCYAENLWENLKCKSIYAAMQRNINTIQ